MLVKKIIEKFTNFFEHPRFKRRGWSQSILYFGSSFSNNRVSLSATIIRFISFYWFLPVRFLLEYNTMLSIIEARSYNFTIVKLLANLINNHVLNRVFIRSSRLHFSNSPVIFTSRISR